jgi:hypothetical protein
MHRCKSTTITSSVHALYVATVIRSSEFAYDAGPTDVWAAAEAHASREPRGAADSPLRLPPAP